MGFSLVASLVAEDGPQSSLPGSGIEPVPPALVGRFFTTESPGKPCCFLLMNQFWYLMIASYGTYELRSVKISLRSRSQYQSVKMYLVKLIFCSCLDMMNWILSTDEANFKFWLHFFFSLCNFPFYKGRFSPVRFSFNPPIGQVFAYHVVPEGSEGFSFCFKDRHVYILLDIELDAYLMSNNACCCPSSPEVEAVELK